MSLQAQLWFFDGYGGIRHPPAVTNNTPREGVKASVFRHGRMANVSIGSWFQGWIITFVIDRNERFTI